jgi:hypothetical protein
MGEGVQDASIWHQDGLGITGALAETAPHDAQEGLQHLNFAVFCGFKDLLGTDLDALQAAVAQFCGHHREPGICSRGKPCHWP